MGGRASATEAVAPTRSAGGQAHSIVDLAVGQRLGPRQRGPCRGGNRFAADTFTSGVVAKLASASATDRSPGSARTCAAPDDRNRTRAEPDAGAGVSPAVDEQEARRTSEPAPPLRQAKAAAPSPSRRTRRTSRAAPREAAHAVPSARAAVKGSLRSAAARQTLDCGFAPGEGDAVRCADRAKDGTKSPIGRLRPQQPVVTRAQCSLRVATPPRASSSVETSTAIRRRVRPPRAP